MDTLVGSSPKASFQTQPTILPSQRSTLDTLLEALTPTARDAVWPTAPGLTPEQSAVTQPLTALAPNVQTSASGTQTAATDAGFDALNRVLGYTPSTVKPQMIDSGSVFKSSVVDPLQKTFDERTIPAITGKYGLGAGGAFSSDAEQARRQAGGDLAATEANYGSQFAYDTSKTNQSTDLAAQTANQTAGLSGAAVQSGGLGRLGSTLAAPNVQTGAGVDILNSIYGTTKDTYNVEHNQADYGLKLLQLLLGGAGGTTQQTVGVGTGGSTGLLGGLTSGLVAAGTPGAGGVSLIGSLLAGSDRRMKDNLERVGEVDGFPLYKFRYKGEPANVRRLGFVAQDVERRRPDAVVTDSRTGLKYVNYTKALERALAA